MSIFDRINYDGDGAAIQINKKEIKIEISECFFHENTGTNRGGSICGKDCKLIKLIKICFSYNYAPYSPAYIMWSNKYELEESIVNYTSEFNYKECDHGSCQGGRNQCLHSYNNVSHLKATNFQWRILTTDFFRNEYSEHYNCTQNNFFDYYVPTTCFNNMINVISCNSASYFIYYHQSSTNDQYYSNMFIINSSFQSLHNNLEKNPKFEKCFIDKTNDNQNYEGIEVLSNIQRTDLSLDFCAIKNFEITNDKKIINKVANFETDSFKLFTIIFLSNQSH